MKATEVVQRTMTSSPARVSLTAAILTATLVASAPATASFYEEAFQDAATGGIACYARSYDAAHLRANSKQRVTFIAFKVSARKADGSANRPGDFEGTLGLRVRNRQELYVKSAYCKPDRSAARCGLESDGGEIRLQAGNDGSLRIDTAGGEIRIEGARDFLEVGGKQSDDNVFRLTRSQADACGELE